MHEVFLRFNISFNATEKSDFYITKIITSKYFQSYLRCQTAIAGFSIFSYNNLKTNTGGEVYLNL